jgi:hypothetical protein
LRLRLRLRLRINHIRHIRTQKIWLHHREHRFFASKAAEPSEHRLFLKIEADVEVEVENSQQRTQR